MNDHLRAIELALSRADVLMLLLRRGIDEIHLSAGEQDVIHEGVFAQLRDIQGRVTQIRSKQPLAAVVSQ